MPTTPPSAPTSTPCRRSPATPSTRPASDVRPPREEAVRPDPSKPWRTGANPSPTRTRGDGGMAEIAAEGAQVPVKAASLRTVVVASSAGTTFEWYDFFVFGSLTG